MNINRKHLFHFYLSFFFQSLILICPSYCAIKINEMINSHYIPTHMKSSFLLLYFLTDIFSLIFVRTRTSLKYYPSISHLIFFIFLFYTLAEPICSYYRAFSINLLLQIILAFGFVFRTEYQAFFKWNDDFIFKPNLNKPRLLFNPLFNLNYKSELPALWTAFFPLFGKSEFLRRNFAFIDRNVGELRRIREENENIINFHEDNNLFSFDENHLLRLPPLIE
jgi:hypothetical protein